MGKRGAGNGATPHCLALLSSRAASARTGQTRQLPLNPRVLAVLESLQLAALAN